MDPYSGSSSEEEEDYVPLSLDDFTLKSHRDFLVLFGFTYEAQPVDEYGWNMYDSHMALWRDIHEWHAGSALGDQISVEDAADSQASEFHEEPRTYYLCEYDMQGLIDCSSDPEPSCSYEPRPPRKKKRLLPRPSK